MDISIGSDAYFGPTDPRQGMARMKAHGFHCIDYQNLIVTTNSLYACNDAEFEAWLRRDAQIARENGLKIHQTHGPWRYPPQDATPEDRQERFKKMNRALWGTSLLDCRYCVIHPLMPFGTNEQPDDALLQEINADFFTRLCRVAEKHQVVICLENMPMPRFPLARVSEILSFVKKIDSPWLRVCLDTGHCAVCGESPAEAVRLLGREYLRVLHVHDNDGTRDQHLSPGEGIIDWTDFSRALQEIGFDGSLSLEVKPRSTPSTEQYEEELLRLAGIARKLACPLQT